MIQVRISVKHISAESVSSENTRWALKRTVLSRCELGDVSAFCFPLQHNACGEEKISLNTPDVPFTSKITCLRAEGRESRYCDYCPKTKTFEPFF